MAIVKLRRRRPRYAATPVERVRRDARRARGVALMTLFLGGVLIVGPLVAIAEDAAPPVEKEGWAWASNDPKGDVEGEIGQDLDPPVPVQDVKPPAPNVADNTLPIGLAGGESEYQSYIQFTLPAVPDGATIETFSVTFTPAGNNGGTPTGVEVCALADFWAAGGNQSYSEAPAPITNCTIGALEKAPAEDGTWTFDLTGAAEAWYAGQIANNGVVLRPVDAENLPSGQAQPTTFQLSFGGAASATPPVTRLTYSTPPPPPPPPPPAQDTSTTTDDTGASQGASSGIEFTSPPVFEPIEVPSTTVPVTQEPVQDPQVAAPAPTTDTAAPIAQPEPVATAPVEQTSPWYVWLLLPLGLVTAGSLGRALVAEPELAVEREGAVSRLLEKRRRERAGLTAAYGAPQV